MVGMRGTSDFCDGNTVYVELSLHIGAIISMIPHMIHLALLDMI